MVSLGKRGVRQTVPSLLRNIHDLQYGRPPPTPQKVHIFTYKKQNRTLKSSLLHQLRHLAVSQCLCSLSEHYQRDVFTLAVTVVPTDTRAHTVRTECDKGNTANRGPLSLVMRYQPGNAKYPGNDIQNNETHPRVICVCV